MTEYCDMTWCTEEIFKGYHHQVEWADESIIVNLCKKHYNQWRKWTDAQKWKPREKEIEK